MLCQQTPLPCRHTGGVLYAMVGRVNKKAHTGKKKIPLFSQGCLDFVQLARPCLLRGKGATEGVKCNRDLIYWKNSLCISCYIVFSSLRHTPQ